ncbi:hypothetical protein EKO04_004434 [Ascochyta lentis]|uniref:Uncharacterized protein n=1 Tax=Ascochyta lentis TaxID=205686 RepID=A0A8H7J7L9_9PLEO|nr:hypothetical protein EKO04_004434 [Ascochyta lentis]
MGPCDTSKSHVTIDRGRWTFKKNHGVPYVNPRHYNLNQATASPVGEKLNLQMKSNEYCGRGQASSQTPTKRKRSGAAPRACQPGRSHARGSAINTDNGIESQGPLDKNHTLSEDPFDGVFDNVPETDTSRRVRELVAKCKAAEDTAYEDYVERYGRRMGL